MSKLTALTDELQSFQKTFAERAKVALSEAFEEFFTANPEIDRLRWTQYAPYFNDGEPCVFGLHGVAAYLTDEVRKDFGLEPFDEDDDDGEGDHYSLRRWQDGKTVYLSPRAEEIFNAVEEFEGALQGLDDYLEPIYGSDSLVKVYRDGRTEVEDYSGEHD